MKGLTILPYKRKRQGKTDYKKRLALLKSGKARLVIRKALNNMLLQIVQYEPDGDKVILTIHGISLKKYGWDVHKGNLSAAYLTGLLCGKAAGEKDIKEAIVDLGLNKSFKGGVQYAAIKGAIDAGLKIPCSEKAFPEESRLMGSDDRKKKFEDVRNNIIGGKE